MTTQQTKNLARTLGSDLCGIAPVSRWEAAPEGFRPTDVDSRARTVIVYAKRMPASTLTTEHCVPYTFVNAVVTQEVDLLTIAFCRALEARGVRAVPIPSDDPYEHWEPARSYGRAILSLRHAGHLAGLGVLGRNTLLLTERFGNMIQIGATLVDAELEPDPLLTAEACPAECRLCLDACPQQALDGTTVDQARCRPLATFRNERGFVLKRCNRCRAVCPRATGWGAAHD
jgi:epoxyqueuosine reductase